MPAGKALKEVGSSAGNSRLAMMELGHVARATAEGLAAGISPARILALELPRIAQAASMSGISLTTITQQFLSSAEFQAKTAGAGRVDSTDLTNTNQLVTDAFQSILGRPAGAGEFRIQSPERCRRGDAAGARQAAGNVALRRRARREAVLRLPAVVRHRSGIGPELA